MVESPVSDACYAVGDRYACEAGAIFESIVSDACYAVGDRYACEAGAFVESLVSDACDRLSVNFRRYCYCTICRFVAAGYCDLVVRADLISINAICFICRFGFGREKACPINARKLAQGCCAEHHDECKGQSQKRLENVFSFCFHCFLPPFYFFTAVPFYTLVVGVRVNIFCADFAGG